MLMGMTRSFGQKLTIVALILIAAGLVLFAIPFPEPTRFYLGGVPMVFAFMCGIAGVIISNTAKH